MTLLNEAAPTVNSSLDLDTEVSSDQSTEVTVSPSVPEMTITRNQKWPFSKTTRVLKLVDDLEM